LDYSIPYSSLDYTMDIQDFYQTFFFLPKFIIMSIDKTSMETQA
jgi:hypothetical protein